MKFEHLDTEAGIKALNQHLEDRSYIEGYVPSQEDSEAFAAIPSAPDAKFPHALRWWNHINSFSATDRSAFPKCSCCSCCSTKETTTTTTTEAPKKEEKKKDDDFDLFEETAEDKAALEEERKRKADEMMKKAKEKGQARSQIVIDVKPWDDETPMDKLEAAVRAIEIEGLNWGQSKLVPVGYGIKKLTIVCVVIDELVSTDDIEEKITGITDYVQSMDVASFNKL